MAVLLALLEAGAALRGLVALTSVAGTGVSLGLGNGRHCWRGRRRVDEATKGDDAQRKGKRFKLRRQCEGSPVLRERTGIHALFVVEGGGGLVGICKTVTA